MKGSIFFILLILFASCRKEEGIWDQLTEAERDALRDRARNKCMTAAEQDITAFTTTSNTELLRLTRQDTWKLEYFKDSSSTALETTKIYVWKIDGNTVYFLYKFNDGGSPTNRFVKFTTTINSEMISDFQIKKCDEDFTGSISGSQLLAKIQEDRVNEDATSYSKTEASHTYKNTYPALFGFLYKTRVKKTYKTSSDVVTATETLKYTITRINDVVLPVDFTSDADYPNKSYCVVDYTAGTPNEYPLSNAQAYGLDCSTDSANGPDPDGDTVENFDPVTELVI